jgi:hypothetical protein
VVVVVWRALLRKLRGGAGASAPKFAFNALRLDDRARETLRHPTHRFSHWPDTPLSHLLARRFGCLNRLRPATMDDEAALDMRHGRINLTGLAHT